ncbi:hypothetical protein BDV96DRAFT_601409 [Lophiotrema nucula]|uniref:Uncharacterized protein n=1 Tax=Lophiotrema nucula TaxID=690887 RepID=A0A6A5Z1B1_9PLEO|nr:hypothetical protein BDV96DRAFT_601409 [Lophiotrema nucula]
MSQLHLRVEAFARIILPLITLAAYCRPHRPVKKFEIRSDTSSGLYPPAGGPTVLEFWYARRPGRNTPVVPPGTSLQVGWAYVFREECELLSFLISEIARKLLPADQCSIAWLRSHAKATLFLVEEANTVRLPLHAFVHIMPLDDDDPDSGWILDGSLQQFGWTDWGRFARPEWYAENFADLQRMAVYPSTPEEHKTMADDVSRSVYWSRVMEITEQIIAAFPWDSAREEQDRQVDILLARAQPQLIAAAQEQMSQQDEEEMDSNEDSLDGFSDESEFS